MYGFLRELTFWQWWAISSVFMVSVYAWAVKGGVERFVAKRWPRAVLRFATNPTEGRFTVVLVTKTGEERWWLHSDTKGSPCAMSVPLVDLAESFLRVDFWSGDHMLRVLTLQRFPDTTSRVIELSLDTEKARVMFEGTLLERIEHPLS